MSFSNKAVGVLTASILLNMGSASASHRTRAHIGLRGSPKAKPTHHPTFPDWDYMEETMQNEYGYPTTSPTYDHYPTYAPTKDETFLPTADKDVSSEDASSQETDDESARGLPNNTRERTPTHHPTFPDWGYMYETSAENRYPTTFPTCECGTFACIHQ